MRPLYHYRFKSMVRPLLEYGNCVWGPVYCGDQDKVERVQRRATRMVASVRHLPYQTRLERLKLPSMHYRRERGDMIMVWQILTGKIRIDPTKLFQQVPVDSTTRGHSLKLLKTFSNHAQRQNIFSQRVINNWNSLTEEVVSAETVNGFKNALDRHWRQRMYRIRTD